MIRALEPRDLDAVMQIWLRTNIAAHAFIPESYWRGHEADVRAQLPQAEVYVYETEDTREIAAFIGLTDAFVAGLFVKEGFQSRGIGTQLLRHAKELKKSLRLCVYEKNARAMAFYRREGFVPESEGTQDGEREITMVWRG